MNQDTRNGTTVKLVDIHRELASTVPILMYTV